MKAQGKVEANMIGKALDVVQVVFFVPNLGITNSVNIGYSYLMQMDAFEV